MKLPPLLRYALGRSLANRLHSSGFKKTLEAVLLPMLAITLVHIWPPSHLLYPWWWLAPLAIALRYGLAFGLGSGLVLIVCQFLVLRLAGPAWTLPPSEVIGGLIATYLAGLYASHARNGLIEANARAAFLERRLESLTRVFYVTRLSHSQLEEHLLTRSNDLYSVLTAIDRELDIPEAMGTDLPQQPLQYLLQTLTFYGRAGTSGVFPVVRGHLDSRPLAHIGRIFELDLRDPLITTTLDKDNLAYYSVDQVLDGQGSRYRVVLPLTAANDTLLALVVIADIPLLALEEENLLTMAAIVAYVGDALRARQAGHEVKAAFPDCPIEFARDWSRLGHMRRHAYVRSSWLLLEPQADAEPGLASLIRDSRRGLDIYWNGPSGHAANAILILLPLAGPGAVQGFIDRIRTLGEEHFGRSPEALGWHMRHAKLQSGSADELRQALSRKAAP